MSETGFRKTWKALLPFVVTVRPMTHDVECPHMNNIYTGLVDNNHAHY